MKRKKRVVLVVSRGSADTPSRHELVYGDSLVASLRCRSFKRVKRRKKGVN